MDIENAKRRLLDSDNELSYSQRVAIVDLIERLKGEQHGKRCPRCKNRHETPENSCVLICCENNDPVRNNTKVSHYVPKAPEVG